MSASQPFTVAAFTADPWESACPHLRIVAPAAHAGLHVVHGAEWAGGALRIFPERVAQAQVVVIQRDFPRWYDGYQRVVEQARRLRRPVIYELDDLLTELPREHPDYEHYHPVRRQMLLAALDADAVTVSTPALGHTMAQYNGWVQVLPNYLDEQVWPPTVRPKRMPDAPIVIGYGGSRSHVHDLAQLEPVLLRLLARYGDRLQLRFWGKTPVPAALLQHPSVAWDAHHDLDYAAYATRLAGRKLDIVIAPLLANEFNAAKSDIKHLEYSALALPGVYGASDAYASVIDGETGYRAADERQWEEALIRLIEDGDLRRQIGHAAQTRVRETHLLEPNARHWRDFYAAVAAGRPSDATLSPAEQLRNAELRLAARERMFRELLDEQLELQRQIEDERSKNAAAERRTETLAAQVGRLEQNVGWLESELQQMRGSITWRATEPIRRLYARVERRRVDRPVEAIAGEATDAAEPAAPVTPATSSRQADPTAAIPYQAERFYWSEATFSAVTGLPTTNVTDIIICIGKTATLAEKCVRSIQQHTDPASYRLKLVVHAADLPNLPPWLAAAGEVVPHDLEIFNFSMANNLALRACEEDAVLLNDDTEVTAGWLEALRADSRGVALTGARTGRQCSGNPDMWEAGPARITWHPINMFCAFIPRRVREVVGLLDEEFFYYGGEDVDYSCRALQHGFPLVVASAFVHHVGNQTFKGKKERLMQESDKILFERYRLIPPFAMHALKPTVSVVTATRNRSDLLPGAVRSILGGSYPELEMLVVDDASTDETPAAVARLQNEDPRVISMRLPQQSGSVVSRLLAVRAARGNFVALMDDDDIAWPERILAPLRHLLQHPDVDVAYCDFDVVTESGRQRGNVQPFDLQAYLDMKFDIGLGVLLIRRQALIDTSFMNYYERAVDYDWVFRLVRRGYKLDYCPAVVLDYNRQGPSESHLAGNEAAIRQHKMIQEREHLVNQLRRR